MENNRKTILINRKFQISLILKFIAINVLITLIFGAFLFLFLNSEVDSNLKTAHVMYKNFQQMLFPIVLTLSIINIMFSSILIFIFVMYSSHKIAGPMFRFNKIILDIKEGKLDSYFKLREGDQLYEISNSLKSLSDELKKDISSINDILENSRKKTSEDELMKSLESINSIISKYKISN